ncbi:hypothetical protein PIB30_074851 [Stylosanthes scabra]|uniref:Uncharacterized protein n=1 Tax=Stylosanthes scabra TaxID=79078 RepID=A0ABU6TPE3_9FABA|nr:hypothetical protein [Stylosanthes scabra]
MEERMTTVAVALRTILARIVSLQDGLKLPSTIVTSEQKGVKTKRSGATRDAAVLEWRGVREREREERSEENGVWCITVSERDETDDEGEEDEAVAVAQVTAAPAWVAVAEDRENGARKGSKAQKSKGGNGAPFAPYTHEPCPNGGSISSVRERSAAVAPTSPVVSHGGSSLNPHYCRPNISSVGERSSLFSVSALIEALLRRCYWFLPSAAPCSQSLRVIAPVSSVASTRLPSSSTWSTVADSHLLW